MALTADTAIFAGPLTDLQGPRIVEAKDRWYEGTRLVGLSRFAIAITALNVLGHLFLGFEQSWLTPFVALAAAYGTEIAGEYLDARASGRRPAYAGSAMHLVRFLLSAHITGLAVGMLLYAAEQLWVIAFAASAAVASKYIFRLGTGDINRPTGSRHFLNPSNLGISLALVLFPSVGIAPPYQFSENISGVVDWLLPLVVICTGSYLNLKATKRMPLILAWMLAFVLQALIRSALNGTPLVAALMPMTGFAFVLFSFYMITDPATSPSRPMHQVLFAAAVATAYGACMQLHIVFGLFYALTAVCMVRGFVIWFGRTFPTVQQVHRVPAE